MPEKFYITTPIYYVNASPHIGHSYTTVAADTIARFMRGRIGKENVLFLTGTDEHGQKVQRAAEEAGVAVREFTDRTSGKFRDLWQALNIQYDDFIRTTEQRHIEAVQKVLTMLYDKGDIFQSKYEGLYCTPCETFWTGTQAEDGLCPDCKRKLESISETNFFFNLSKYQEALMKHIASHPGFIRPRIRENEVMSFLEHNRLSDLCISRPKERLGWGIPLPFSPDHVTYVWFDALINYISAIGFARDRKKFDKFWPADIHIMAKDILRQHAIYWPIMLMALGEKLPEVVFAHGWWKIDEKKMSKSLGNVVDPYAMVEKYGVEAYRYFLLREVQFGFDGNFSEEALVKRVNSDLANDLGNLAHRSATMLEKYCAGKLPEKGGAFPADFDKALKELPEAVEAFMLEYNFSAALEKIWGLINKANKYIEDTKPWALAKEKKDKELYLFLNLLVEVIKTVAAALAALMPQASQKLLKQFSAPEIKKGEPLFPRIETN
ncbi:MAG: methionine--tRNA ligase [Candidatus Omnitrophica bacterium]|nr:methionine--tRNA ligase [Candidatus Omnitrophota bacterium]